MEDKNLIGQRIKEARESLDLSQEELGRQIGVSFQSVQQWEAGKTTPRSARMRKLASVLKTSPTYLQFGVGAANPESIDTVSDLLLSDEFRNQELAAFARTIRTAISLRWLSCTRTDVSVGMLADLHYNHLLQEYGLDMPKESSDDKRNSG